MLKKIYLVRHGETEYNIQGRLQGQSDSPLTPNGIEQARALRKTFDSRGIHFKRAYSSDLKRAVETMKLLADPDTEGYAVAGLREITFGEYDGCRKEDFPAGENWESVCHAHGGESFEEVSQRALEAISSILAREINAEDAKEEDPILLVSHSGTIASLLDRMGLQQQAAIPNSSAFVLGFDGRNLKLLDFFTAEEEKTDSQAD